MKDNFGLTPSDVSIATFTWRRRARVVLAYQKGNLELTCGIIVGFGPESTALDVLLPNADEETAKICPRKLFARIYVEDLSNI